MAQYETEAYVMEAARVARYEEYRWLYEPTPEPVIADAIADANKMYWRWFGAAVSLGIVIAIIAA